MPSTDSYSQSGLSRLAVVLLRQNHPTTVEEGRAALQGALGVYATDGKMLDRAVSDYFRRR